MLMFSFIDILIQSEAGQIRYIDTQRGNTENIWRRFAQYNFLQRPNT